MCACAVLIRLETLSDDLMTQTNVCWRVETLRLFALSLVIIQLTLGFSLAPFVKVAQAVVWPPASPCPCALIELGGLLSQLEQD